MKYCCVIGGTGFIGSHLVELLHKHGRQVTVVGRNPQPSRMLPDGVRYVAGDYGDRYFLTGVLQGIEEVINLAYTTVPKTSFEDPVRDILDNLPASVNLFEVARDLGIKKLVLVSSGGTVYGEAQKLPISESHPTDPISPYGISKLAIEKYAMMFNKNDALPVVCVRPGNAYGVGQRPFVGQGFIATAMASLLKGVEITLFGDTGTIRDYVHVVDVAHGILAILEQGAPGSCYNIGSGIGRSNRDILDAIYPHSKKAGIEMRIRIEPLRHFDVSANVLDCSKLQGETGWKTMIKFQEGIESTWEWFLKNALNGPEITKR
jgi:UDP-glucose 4-epimerase